MAAKYRAVFARGGTSKALIFRAADLPADQAEWDQIFLTAMGSPDAYGRQLNGMGGGVSSLSKICIVGEPTHPDADVDYLFAQVLIKDAKVDYSGNCGNMSSAIGPFAVDEGLVKVADGETTVRIHNVNTRKIINSTFAVSEGRSVAEGDLIIPGVSGGGAPVRLDFLEPGGASTGKLLPTGNPVDILDIPEFGQIAASMVDAANACVFVSAEGLGLSGAELPQTLNEKPDILAQLATLRAHASVAMGLAKTIPEARGRSLLPLIAFVSPPRNAVTLDGNTIDDNQVDLVIRMISNGQPHNALPLTGSLCTAIAAGISGSIVNGLVRKDRTGPLRLSMPSGVIVVEASVEQRGSGWHATHGSFYRTTRRLFEGYVHA